MARERQNVRNQPSEHERSADQPGDVDLDLFAQGPLSSIVERFRSRLLGEAAKIAGERKIDANDLEQAYERLLRPVSAGDWPILNRRRVYLIKKQISGDVSPEELVELEHLQAQADGHMSEVAPRPLEMLWDLKRKLTDQ
ncbi:MAG: hypothetical protein H8E44_24695 [Planctomycetes bacterium]|nr:hypothetical protein [Planctomycetota bacterium]MBL7040185.1 hypothetical protein [Pirellulaceae bacterium]